MTDDLTPERARAQLALDPLYGCERHALDIIAAWERDRAELLERRRSCVTCGARNLAADGIHSCYDRDALLADAVRERDALRERLAATESELERERMRNAACSSAALGYHTESEDMHPDYDSASLQDVMRLRTRLAEVTAQRDALVPFARWELENYPPLPTKDDFPRAEAALAAIAAEQTTTTGGQDDE